MFGKVNKENDKISEEEDYWLNNHSRRNPRSAQPFSLAPSKQSARSQE
jgi:hypothetical protein